MGCLLWMDPALADLLEPRLRCPVRRIHSRRELEQAFDMRCMALFADGPRLPETGVVGITTPVIGVIDEPLHGAIGWLNDYPWVGHILTRSVLIPTDSDVRLGALVRSLRASEELPRPIWFIGNCVRARAASLVESARRGVRLDRMAQFLEAQGVGARTVSQLHDVAEELITNAFYNAPVAAGYLSRPVSRSEDLILPPDRRCRIAYGVTEDLAFVSVQDTFGSLERRRLVEVLRRCARTDSSVRPDESMGGAGLGVWRIFSAASVLALTVVEGESTEIVVGVRRRRSPTTLPGAVRPYSLHLFFTERASEAAGRAVQAEPSELEISTAFQVP